MGPFIGAWFIGEGIIVWRAITKTHAPPVPGALLASSGLFAGLAIIAESDTLRPLATVLAYGFDVAAVLNLWPSVTSGGAPPATAAKQTGGKQPAKAGSSSTMATPAQASA